MPLQKDDTTKNCPKCGKLLSYSNKYDCRKSILKNSPCRECVAKEHKVSGRYCGANNPFYGKTHSDETKSKISIIHKGIKQTGIVLETSRRTIKLAKAAQCGKSCYQLWIDKYGKEIADAKMNAVKRKWSKSSSGKNNPMYGKPTPNGAGNGWANWYDGQHFRSIRELQYYISEIDIHNILCESAQQKRFRIPYKDYNGVDRTYRPDFFVDNHWLIEIKPKKLWNTKEVTAKKEAAEKFCNKMGYEYKLVDVEPNSLLLKEKYLNGEIRFVDKYKSRFEKYIGIKNI